MMENPYSYKMPYVPLASQVIDLKNVHNEPVDDSSMISAKVASAHNGQTRSAVGMNDLTVVSIDAINSMLAMCSMVYMMCLQQLGGEEPEELDEIVRPVL